MKQMSENNLFNLFSSQAHESVELKQSVSSNLIQLDSNQDQFSESATKMLLMQ